MVNYIESVDIFKKLGYLSLLQTEQADSENRQQMLEMWNLLKGAGSEDEDKVKLVNIKRFFCALEGIPTSKLLRKTIQYDTETL